MLGVVERTVRGWETTGVPAKEVERVAAILGGVGDDTNPLREASNWALLSEIGRRLDDADQLLRRDFESARGKGGRDARQAEAEKSPGKVGRGSRLPR